MTDPLVFHPIVATSDVFAGLSRDQIQVLMPMVVRRQLRDKEHLFRQGDWGDAMALLTDGRLQVFTHDGAGIVPLDVIEPGQVVGEMSCIDPAPRTATVSALESTMAIVLDRNGLAALRQNAPDVAISIVSAITRRVVQRLRDTDDRLVREMGMEGDGADATGELHEDTPSPAIFEAIGPDDVPPTAGLSPEDARALLEIGEPLLYDPGQVIFRENDPGNACHVLLRGQVNVSHRLGAKEHHLATLDPGVMIGQISLLDRRPRSATVRAVGSVLALEITRERYEALLASASPFAVRLQDRVAVAAIRQLRGANRKLVPLLRQSGIATRITAIPGATPIARVSITRAAVALREWTLDIEEEEE